MARRIAGGSSFQSTSSSGFPHPASEITSSWSYPPVLPWDLLCIRFPSAPVETPQIKVISGVSHFPRSQAPLGNARLEAPLLRIWISHLPWMPRPVVAPEETLGLTTGGPEVAELVPPTTTDHSTPIHVVHHCDGSSHGGLRLLSTSTSTPGRNPHKIPNRPAGFGWHQVSE